MNRTCLVRLLGLTLVAATLAPAMATASDVWPALTTDHVFPDSTKPATAEAGLKLMAARGEQEGGQVAVRPDAVTTVPATVGDLTGPGVIPAAKVSVYRVGYTKLTQPSTGVGPLHGDGRYGDALIPVTAPITLPGGETTSIYVLVDVGADQAPGTYTGELNLGSLGQFPVSVDVAPVTASRDQFPIVARLHTINLAASLGVDTSNPEFARGVYDNLLPMLRSRGISPGRIPLADPVVDAGSGQATFGPRVDGNVNAFLGMGFPSVEVPFLPNLPRYAAGEDREYKAPQRAATASSIAARYASVASKSYSLVVDEPTDAEYPTVNRAATILHATNPRIPVMVTEAPSAKAVKAMGASVDIWTPPLWDLYKDPAATRRVVQQGKTLWWYTYGSDTQRYTPNVLIDKSGADPRLLGWLAQKEGVQGFFYWGLNNWGGKDKFASPNQNAWYLSHTTTDIKCGTTKRMVGGNGEASLIWPGSGPSQPAYGSLRLESLRDGAEDYSLLTQLQSADPATYRQVMNGLSQPFSGTTDGDEGDACGDYARPGYLPVVADSPGALDGARRVVIAKLSGRPLATLSGRVVAPQARETGRGTTKRGKATSITGVHGAIVRFGTLETTTKPNGSWSIPNVPDVPGDLAVSMDPEGSIGAVSVPVDAATLAAGGGVVSTPPLPTDASRPLVGPGLGRFRAAARPAKASERAGTVTLTVSNKYNAGGKTTFSAGGKTPSVEAFYERTAASRAARNWKGYRYLDMTVEVRKRSKEGQRWYLIVTPGGHYMNSRNLAIGRKVQNIRVDLRRAHPSKGKMKGMGNVKYVRFGLQSALPQVWREGHAPTVTLRVSNMRLVK